MLLAEMPITIYVYIDRNVQNLKKPGCGRIIVHYHLGAPVGANKEENGNKEKRQRQQSRQRQHEDKCDMKTKKSKTVKMIKAAKMTKTAKYHNKTMDKNVSISDVLVDIFDISYNCELLIIKSSSILYFLRLSHLILEPFLHRAKPHPIACLPFCTVYIALYHRYAVTVPVYRIVLYHCIVVVPYLYYHYTTLLRVSLSVHVYIALCHLFSITKQSLYHCCNFIAPSFN